MPPTYFKNKMKKSRIKLIQVNKGELCPNCGRYTLVYSHDYSWINNKEVIMWDYKCTHCNSKFYDEAIYNK
jgi:C4-type Zn-finger protein